MTATDPAQSQERAQRLPPTMYGLFRKKVYRLPELWRDLKAMRPHARAAAAIWRGQRFDPGFREEIMVAVARVNGCRWCSFVHQEWALTAGVPDTEIAQLEGLAPDDFDRDKWVALAYAQALAANDFGNVAPEVHDAAVAVYGHDGRHDIETVARVMTLVNRSANAIDALLARLRRNPAPGSRLVDELVITSMLFLGGPGFVIWFTAKTRKAPWRLWREFRRFSDAFDRNTTSQP